MVHVLIEDRAYVIVIGISIGAGVESVVGPVVEFKDWLMYNHCN